MLLLFVFHFLGVCLLLCMFLLKLLIMNLVCAYYFLSVLLFGRQILAIIQYFLIIVLKQKNMKEGRNKLSRRQFLGTSALGMAGMLILPSIGCNRGKKASVARYDLVKLGFIGLGQQAMFLLNGFLRIPGVEVLAGSDVYGIKRTRFEKRVGEFYAKAGKKADVKTYEKFEDLLARKDIDAVVIATPDHYHALIAIAACKAGKDVYLEKPLTFTIYEGQMLRKTVRENNRILAVGSQQRSDDNFKHAVNLVQTGTIGKLSLVKAYVGAPPKPYDLPEEPIPADLNWDRWLGPLPGNIHYNSQLNPPISLDPPKDEQIWGAWKWAAALQPTGELTCSTSHSGGSAWITAVQ